MPSGSRMRFSLLEWLEERFNVTEMFSLLTCFGLFPAELDTRRPLNEAVRDALERPLPSYARWPRVLGILSLLTFLLLGVTGVMLAFYYQPTPGSAYASVTTVVRDVSFGWFIHQVHGWGGQVLLLILLLRAWRFYFQGLYRSPREAIWMLSLASFLVAAASDATGRLLPWDQTGYWGTVRGLEVVHALPLLGPLVDLLSGAAEINSLTLVRFYLLHVLLLPGLLVLLFYLNFSSVRRAGLSPVAGPERPGMAAFRIHLYSILIIALLIFGALATVATLLPAPFGQPADPFVTPPGTRSPWYLLPASGLLYLFPGSVPRAVPGLLIEALLGAAFLLPFFDGRPEGAPARSRIVLAAGVVLFVLLALLAVHGYRIEAGR